MSAKAAYLEDRGVVSVTGAEAAAFLQGLFTNDVVGLAPGEARFAALLSPQGKILVDFFVVRLDEGATPRFLLDAPRALCPDLTKKLVLYRLRARLDIADRSDELGVAAWWDGAPLAGAFRDARAPEMGWRRIAPRSEISGLGDAGYDAHRIACGTPKGGVDFAYGDAFPHDANLDLIAGVDFAKGCYVGQEVVSRVQHRGTARKRVVPVRFDGAAPAAGTEIRAGDVGVGAMGSSTGQRGLATLRIDKAEGAALTCDGRPLTADLRGFSPQGSPSPLAGNGPAAGGR